MTNTEELKKAIKKSGMKIGAILEMMNMRNYSTLKDKIENRREFTASEIMMLCDILRLNKDEMEKIFFAPVAEYHSA